MKKSVSRQIFRSERMPLKKKRESGQNRGAGERIYRKNPRVPTTYYGAADISRRRARARARAERSGKASEGPILIYIQHRGEGRPGIHHLYFNHTTRAGRYI